MAREIVFLTEIRGLNKASFAGPEIVSPSWEEAETIASRASIVVIGHTEETGCCRNCRWWESDNNETGMGECRALPPNPEWPRTVISDSCGAFA